jgi:hypothetical protein
MGLDSIVRRNFVKDPEKHDKLLGNVFYMKLRAEIVAVILTISAAYFIKQEDKFTLYLITLNSKGFIFNQCI